MNPTVSLDQWRALLAVIDQGGYAQAAEFLNKSQSAVSYLIRQLETQLGVAVFEIQGRRAVPTVAGQMLQRRARVLLDEAAAMEQAAAQLGRGVEAEVALAADLIVPAEQVLRALQGLYEQFPATRVELIESVLSGTEDALVQRQVDLAITTRVPVGFLGDPVVDMPMVAVAHPGHALLLLDRELTYADLRRHRQLVVRDSGVHRRHSEGWQGSEQRLTVGHLTTSLRALRLGLGYAWLPAAYVRDYLDRGELALLPLREGALRRVTVYLVYADRDCAGPATRRLAELLREQLATICAGH